MADTIKAVSFQSALPADDQFQLAKQQRLAQLLQQQAATPMEPNQMVSGRVVPIGWAQGLNKLAQGYFAGQAEDKAGALAKQLVGKQQAERNATIQGMQGVDQDTAIKLAMASNDPVLQQIGLSMWQKRMEPTKYGTTPHYDQNGNAYVTDERGNKKLIEGTKQREEMSVGPAGQVYNKYELKPGQVLQDPNKPFALGQNGGVVSNDAYQNYEKSRARAGAAQVSVNTAQQPFLQGLGKTAGEAVQAGYDQAKAAQDVLRNVSQIRSAGDKIYIGPGANARVALAQIGETLGINGKDTTEKLANTRNVFQGLARQELAAANQMKGQGQITENERKILQKAESGDIANMSKIELNTLMGALEKTANYRINTHNQTLERLQKDPNAAPMVPYLTLPGTSQAPAAPSGNRQIVVDY